MSDIAGRIDGRRFRRMTREQQFAYVGEYLGAVVVVEQQPDGSSRWLAVQHDDNGRSSVRCEAFSIHGLIYPESNTERATRVVAHLLARRYQQRRHSTVRRGNGLEQLEMFGGDDA